MRANVELGKRVRIALSILGSLLLVIALFLPWWSATARLPEGRAVAQLTLYSFRFESPAFRCEAVLFFYSYGTCPLLGSGAAMLAFYSFWTLFFLALSFCIGLISALSVARGHAGELGWLPVASLVLSALCDVSFIAAISTAGLKFVSGNALYGSSDVLDWTISSGFVLAFTSTILQGVHVYFSRRWG